MMILCPQKLFSFHFSKTLRFLSLIYSADFRRSRVVTLYSSIMRSSTQPNMLSLLEKQNPCTKAYETVKSYFRPAKKFDTKTKAIQSHLEMVANDIKREGGNARS